MSKSKLHGFIIRISLLHTCAKAVGRLWVPPPSTSKFNPPPLPRNSTPPLSKFFLPCSITPPSPPFFGTFLAKMKKILTKIFLKIRKNSPKMRKNRQKYAEFAKNVKNAHFWPFLRIFGDFLPIFSPFFVIFHFLPHRLSPPSHFGLTPPSRAQNSTPPLSLDPFPPPPLTQAGAHV